MKIITNHFIFCVRHKCNDDNNYVHIDQYVILKEIIAKNVITKNCFSFLYDFQMFGVCDHIDIVFIAVIYRWVQQFFCSINLFEPVGFEYFRF